MKIRNNIKSNKDLRMKKVNLNKIVASNIKWEAVGLANSLNQNYHSWLDCVTDTKDYCIESRDFGHGFGVFSGSKYFRIEASGKSGCNSIIDQKNSKLYKTAHKDKHVWGYVAKKTTDNYNRGDILTKNYKVVGNVLTGNKVNLGMPNSHYPNYTVCWAHNDIWA